MISKKLFATVLLSLVISFSSKAQKTSLKTTDVNLSQVTVKEEKYKNKNAMVLEIQGEVTNEKTLAVLKNIDFHNGTIEATVSGQTSSTASETARGFVGIAFRVAEDISKMEVFYLRPTNGRANDQVRRNHSTQYISWPGYPWEKLRKETPEKYESYADLVPGEWTKVKIEVKNETAKLYINGASQPTLIVNDLKQGGNQRGSIGLWIGPGTLGHFTDLKITKLD
ncbi:family 16 glycoside hydrolase [Chryseobacterium phocaeense]|uniref:family 16 glycoside hydrolase n=1 Tax=Chryseobacterium phocaeense TaxID=1816690 RepID=UPI0009B9611D|nr:hypothetical protein [Chryseobacterium phocaeense]